jgi:predicted acyl esterase
MSQKGASAEARRGSQIVIGPWGHGPSQKYGALDFGPEANVDALALQLRWYDYWMKGIDNGLASEPPVKLFVMGRNEWVYEREYPLARTRYQPLYLASGGAANSSRGDGRLRWEKPTGASPPDRFRYDPADPVPSLGGNNCCGTPTPAGPMINVRSKAGATFSSTTPTSCPRSWRPPAREGGAVRVLGRGRHRLRREAGGRASRRIELQHGGGSPARPLSREPEPAEAPDSGTGVSAGDRPRRNLGRVSPRTPHPDPRHEQPLPAVRQEPEHGAPFGTTAEVRIAQQTIYHDAERASHVLLPVIPRR